MDKGLLHPGERVDDLLCQGLKIIQHPDSYCFSMDAVLLANFAKARREDRIIDLGTGSGVIPLLLSAKTEAREIIGVEIAEEIAQRAKRSVEMNRLDHRIKIISADLKEAPRLLGMGGFSVVVTNPPYMVVGEGKISPHRDKALARHELEVTLAQVIEVGQRLLKNGGRFYMVHRTVRLAEALGELRLAALEPKILQLIGPRAGEKPNLFLIMAQKGAGQGLEVLPTLSIYDNAGEYTYEIRRMYFEEVE
jgi:tRNA1Val (adenine37-N6)-methyltransferase